MPPLTKTPYSVSPWSLVALFPGQDTPEMEAAFESLDTQTSAFENRRTQLAPAISVELFMEIVQQLEEIRRVSTKVYVFSQLQFTENTQSQEAQTFVARVQKAMAGLQNRTLFFSLWWKALDEENAARLMAGAGDYRYWLQEMRNFKPHTLTEPEEKIINVKELTGSTALRTLYDTITNRYTFKLEIEGETHDLTRGQLMAKVYERDAGIRQRAYQELTRVYAEDGHILGQIYQVLARDWHNENVDLRHFASPISARNLNNDIPDGVVDTLLNVCEQNTGVFQRFFKLKAHWLGLKRLRRHDIYAPVVEAEKPFAYAPSVEMVLDAFHEFEPRVAVLAQKVFDENHIDSEVRKGKMGGAFCAGIDPIITPWVLTNFQGTARDVTTLAHELGHAIHAMLASHHTAFTFRSSLPLAETASTFSEMLLVDRLLADEEDEQVRVDLLFRQVDDAYATIMRQAFFAMFERQAHDMVREGASVDDLSAAYLENLRSQFGDAIEISDDFRWEWVSIQHIYNVPFYVYAYTFGQLLVLSLYQQYKVEGEAFKPRYLRILAAGGSAAPANILADAGIDIRSAAFWQGGFDVIADWVEQLEAIPPLVSETSK